MWDGGAPGVAANDAETFGLQNLQTAVVGDDVLLRTGAAYVTTERINSLYSYTRYVHTYVKVFVLFPFGILFGGRRCICRLSL